MIAWYVAIGQARGGVFDFAKRKWKVPPSAPLVRAQLVELKQ